MALCGECLADISKGVGLGSRFFLLFGKGSRSSVGFDDLFCFGLLRDRLCKFGDELLEEPADLCHALAAYDDADE